MVKRVYLARLMRAERAECEEKTKWVYTACRKKNRLSTSNEFE
jgi:hypothetical protein